jgi:hypothetical protein
MSKAAVQFEPPPGRSIIVCLWFASFAIGIADPFIPSTELGSFLKLVETAVLTLMLAYWCHLDAAYRGFKMAKWLVWAIALTGLVALPFYFFLTRSVLEAFRGILLAALVVAAMTATAMAAIYVSYAWLCETPALRQYCTV